jgi:hypothetical protein
MAAIKGILSGCSTVLKSGQQDVPPGLGALDPQLQDQIEKCACQIAVKIVFSNSLCDARNVIFRFPDGLEAKSAVEPTRR